jgi:hypothetical protein
MVLAVSKRSVQCFLGLRDATPDGIRVVSGLAQTMGAPFSLADPPPSLG